MVINDKVRIERLDKYCLGIKELTDVEDKKTHQIKKEWKIAGYYGNLEQALQGVLKHQLMNVDEVEDIQGLLWYIQQCNDEILKAIKDNK